MFKSIRGFTDEIRQEASAHHGSMKFLSSNKSHKPDTVSSSNSSSRFNTGNSKTSRNNKSKNKNVEVDGKSENDTVVHKALLKFYKTNGLDLPSFLNTGSNGGSGSNGILQKEKRTPINSVNYSNSTSNSNTSTPTKSPSFKTATSPASVSTSTPTQQNGSQIPHRNVQRLQSSQYKSQHSVSASPPPQQQRQLQPSLMQSNSTPNYKSYQSTPIQNQTSNEPLSSSGSPSQLSYHPSTSSANGRRRFGRKNIK